MAMEEVESHEEERFGIRMIVETEDAGPCRPTERWVFTVL